MKNKYLLLSVAGLLAGSARAQTLDYTTGLAATQAGTYADLGATGTVIATANTDDAYSAAQPIGFPFVFDGTTYTQFVLNTNGFIKLGSTVPAVAAAFPPYAQQGTGGPVDNAALTDLVLPFNTDLMSSASAPAEYRVLTTGTAPNRICTVQWKNVADKARPTNGTTATLIPAQLASFAFQLQIFEADRHVAFVYGPVTSSGATSSYTSATVGLKGTGNGAGTGQLVLAQKSSSSSWVNTIFVDVPYGADFGHNVRNTYLPDAGRTYTFGVPVANDAAVSEINALGTALVPGPPQSVTVVVHNAGSTQFASAPLTLTVSGANTVTALTQQTGTLGVGADAVLTFTGLSLSAAGTNTITASLPTDGNSANNVLTQALQTSTSDISYRVGTLGANNGGQGYNANATSYTGAFLARFSLSAPRSVTSVQAYLTSFPTAGVAASTVGQTVYGVVISLSTGAVIARSPNYTVTASDVNTTHAFALSVPVTVPAGDFLAGLAQVVPAGGLPYYPMGLQVEVPTRPELFYALDDVQSGAAPSPYLPSFGSRLLLGVSTSAVLATTLARTLVLSAYPNPSATGDFTLEVSGQRGTSDLPVEVTNLLGQRVYRGTARAGARTALPLAGLAPGLYTLRVGQDAEYGQQQLCIAR